MFADMPRAPEQQFSPETARPSSARRFFRAFGPILAGAVIDAADLATLGAVGFIVGTAAGYVIAAAYGLNWKWRIGIALLAGYYCMIPFTRFIPLATLVGAYVRFRQG